MMPYKPTKNILKIGSKVKPIPSPQLMNILSNLCQGSENNYDRKNHILAIRDINQYLQRLRQRYGRSAASFQKQLKMLGFKKKKIAYENMPEKQVKIMFSWKGKKQQLIHHELLMMENNLSCRKAKTKLIKQQIRMKKQIIDNHIQSIIMSMMVNPTSINAKQSLTDAISETRKMVNSVQLEARKIITQISSTLGNQLQLYRLLIYKDQNMGKKDLKFKEDDDDQYGDKNSEEQNKDQNDYEEHPQSEVSIQISQPKSQQYLKNGNNEENS